MLESNLSGTRALKTLLTQTSYIGLPLSHRTSCISFLTQSTILGVYSSNLRLPRKSTMPIGPALPPHLTHLAAASSRSPSASPPLGPSVPAGPAVLVDKEEEEEEYVPALPPHLLAARKARASSSGVEKKAASPSIGTSVGPSVGITLPAAGPSRPSPVPGPSFPEDYDSDDELIGPVPVPTAGGEEDDDEAQAAVREFLEREERRRKQAEEKDKPKALQREEWMLVPPSSGVLSNGKSIISKALSGY